MKTLKHISLIISALTLALSLYQCASTPKLQKEAPNELEDVYFQRWNAGTEEGGSGINIFIKTKTNSIQLDSVYFRGKITKLLTNQKDSLVYIGRFKSKSIVKVDKSSDLPFKLKDDECVISYLIDKNRHYYKISNIVEHRTLNYPSASPNKQ